ncbi:MarR family winged helix-turn-helix transcriptional regulator [Jannaschia sp. M317]|uniref:MarR family winged helix-turn-helix transcriptional regulator n=1 Tax=Jannaschia sp. M317 TaxID=2867011 RepID=UPI0021A63541|nr:MarR family transcriptional regulator [Jannaschia sp. M317]UWQ17784.1 MarR family transcriptional regulator [Jannaschia sp. M317]
MAKPHSPKQLAELIDTLAPALRRLQGKGAAHGPRITALSHLAKDGPATMRDLATRLNISPQAVTGLIDGLEQEGLVARERHPTDRRKVLIRLNDHAAPQVQAARADRTDTLASLFEGTTKEDRAAFARVAETLLARLG